VAPVAARAGWIEETVALAGAELRVLRPPDADALLTDEAFERDEFLPYWASLWPSAVALARELARTSLRGARTLELGCGLGLPSIAAARAGGAVTATDWSPEAIAATRANAALNGVALESRVSAWDDPGALLEDAPWDLVLASDVLYERRNVELLLDLLPRLVGGRGEVLLADPDRAPAEAFVERVRERLALRTRPLSRRPRVTLHRLRARAERA
jgi:predicted nicotinamide N-methyase